jgi:hypothetical protein
MAWLCSILRTTSYSVEYPSIPFRYFKTPVGTPESTLRVPEMHIILHSASLLTSVSFWNARCGYSKMLTLLSYDFQPILQFADEGVRMLMFFIWDCGFPFGSWFFLSVCICVFSLSVWLCFSCKSTSVSLLWVYGVLIYFGGFVYG